MSAKADDEDVLPGWYTKEFVEPLNAGIASVFIVHGDINCLVRDPDTSNEPGKQVHIPMRSFLVKMFEERKLVIFYDISNGPWFLSRKMEDLFRDIAGLKPPKGGDALADAKAALAAKRELPRDPETCLPLIDRVLRQLPGTAVIIKSAHTIAPMMGGGAALPANERATIERLRIWGQSTQIRKNGNIVLLMTDQASKISGELRLGESEIRTVFIPKPSKDERRGYIASQPGGKSLELDSLSSATQGLSLRQISELFKQAKAAARPLDLEFVKAKKDKILNDEYGDVMEVVEPKLGLEDIGGHEHIKAYFREVLGYIRRGENRLVPMGVTLTGPPGTGKTAFVEALAKEAGFIFVQTRNIRSMFVGDSEARMEKMISGLRALTPVVVMNDEADLAEAQRDSPKGDSGVSERLRREWMKLLSDPKIRGRIVVVNCTNRPDRIDAALKRSGRSDEIILLPMPSEEERAAIFRVMFRRHDIPTDIVDFAPFAEATGMLSGANIEKVSLTAFRFATQEGKAKVDDASLREAIRDFIPPATVSETDAMTVAGLLECSSRKLLPPHIEAIVEGIRLRGTIANFDTVIESLRTRGILGPAPIVLAAPPSPTAN